ncbi:MAG: type II secretion system GspH family protein [Cellvibrionaceae bacterium]|nr:type II secretion system GspH family protein [Cellvibrionaceae bacterium]
MLNSTVMRSDNATASGFTLIELLAVILIMSIVALMSTAFFITTTKSMVLFKQKSQLLINSRLVLESMVQQLRLAQPYSLRLMNAEQCVQFMPIVAGGYYLRPVSDRLNGDAASGYSASVSTAPYETTASHVAFMAIGATAANQLYGVAAGSLSAVQAHSPLLVTLREDKQWLNHSVRQRFYLLDRPSAFCLIDDELRYYQQLSPVDSVINLAADYRVMAQSVRPLSQAFTLIRATAQQNTTLMITLNFVQGEQQLPVSKYVVLANVP